MKRYSQIFNIILVPDFCPLISEIAQFFIRFCLNLLTGYVKGQVLFLENIMCGKRPNWLIDCLMKNDASKLTATCKSWTLFSVYDIY